jgi:APA family basic amino acid/polyamine antiporter
MPDSGGRLLRVLGVGFGLAVIIGNTIGAGILRAPGEVAAHLPQPGLFLAAWLAGGLYSLIGAFQIAELGTMLPRSGAHYVFTRHALGDYPGFVVGWSDWLGTCGTAAAVSLVIAEFSTPFLAGAGVPVPVLAGTVALAFAAAQWRGIREGSLVQNVTSALKALMLLGLVVAAFASDGPDPTRAPLVDSAGPAVVPLAVAFVLALQGVIYTYDGWAAVVYFSEEVRDPARDIPRSLVAGVLSIVTIYLLLNLSFLHVLPMQAIAGEPFVAGAVGRVLFGSLGDTLLRVLTIVALLSALNSNHLMASRVLLAMSRDGLVTRRAARVNAGGTPTIALLLSALAALSFIALGRTFAQVITVLAFFFIAIYALSFTSLFVLRWREPDRPRPYRAWGYPWTTAAALIGSVAFLGGAVAADTRNSIYALMLLAASYPAFLVMRRRGSEAGHE